MAKEQQNRLFLTQLNQDGLKWLLYMNKNKSLDWFDARGLQLPKEEPIKALSKKNILFDTDIVKQEDTPDNLYSINERNTAERLLYTAEKISEIEIAPVVNTTQNAIEADALSTRIGAIKNSLRQ